MNDRRAHAAVHGDGQGDGYGDGHAPDRSSLRGRRALVTGAGRGIGRAAARALAARGADVVLMARSPAELGEVADAIRAGGGRASTVPVDLTDDAALSAAMREAGDADILVNCAGTNRPEPFVRVAARDLDDLLALNFRAVFLTTQRFVASLLERGRRGVIVNVTSQMGHVGAPDRSVYCATKHAVEGLTKALAVELAGHGIRVLSVAPTFVETAMTGAYLADPRFRESVLAQIPLGRMGTPEEVADVVAFAASPAAELITGSSLLADGGWVAR
ncbi:SDR family NAD(P)-dependent oxidoreductase [Nonomuraea sp. B5E05]|uniref:SDR family NAD(P)-dependent oxidoreductase n=1 Tax=Nonomuraea sp. B5E05 TaxID=3153569 RepID=UPI0032602F2A